MEKVSMPEITGRETAVRESKAGAVDIEWKTAQPLTRDVGRYTECETHGHSFALSGELSGVVPRRLLVTGRVLTTVAKIRI